MLPPRTIVAKHVQSLSARNRSTVCPTLKQDLRNFGVQSEATLIVRTVGEEEEAFDAIKTFGRDFGEAVPGLKDAFPQAGPTIDQLESDLKVFRSTVAANGAHWPRRHSGRAVDSPQVSIVAGAGL
jgi:hypothetical protein